MQYLKIKEIVHTISVTHKFDKDCLIAINTSDVDNGVMGEGVLTPVNELKGQFKKTIQKHDILFSEIRPANRRFAMVQLDNCENYVVSTKLMVLRKFNDDVDLNYFYYCLTNQPFLDILQRRAENRIGSFPQITFDLLSEYSFPIPPLKEQKSIANCIANLDSKITINRAINQNLEALAKQIYDYWFLQFDFPNKEGKPYKSSGGTMKKDSRTNRLLPENWDVKTIQEIESNIITGKTPSTSDETNFGGEIPFITIDDIRNAPYIYTTERTLTEKGANSQRKKFLPVGSLCCSCIGTPGIIGFVGKRGQTNQQINSIVFEDNTNKEFLYFALKVHFQFAKAKTGNILLNMSKEEFSEILVVYPHKDILKKFHDITSGIFSMINSNVKELNILTKQRDELLPLLMNGQVTID